MKNSDTCHKKNLLRNFEIWNKSLVFPTFLTYLNSSWFKKDMRIKTSIEPNFKVK